MGAQTDIKDVVLHRALVLKEAEEGKNDASQVVNHPEQALEEEEALNAQADTEHLALDQTVADGDKTEEQDINNN